MSPTLQDLLNNIRVRDSVESCKHYVLYWVCLIPFVLTQQDFYFINVHKINNEKDALCKLHRYKNNRLYTKKYITKVVHATEVF